MDPKLKEQLFIRKHRNSIITVIIMVLILPMLLIFPQTGTLYQQQAAETKNKPNITAYPRDYTTFIKCFDKPNQINPCSPEEHKTADLNNDGIVDGIDYNLFIHKKTGQK